MIRAFFAGFKPRPRPDYGFHYNVDVAWPSVFATRPHVRLRGFGHRAKDNSVWQTIPLEADHVIAFCANWQGSTTEADIELWLRASKPRWWSASAEFTVEMYTIGVMAGSLPGWPMVEVYGERPSGDRKVAHLAGVYRLQFDDAKNPTRFDLFRLANDGGRDPHTPKGCEVTIVPGPKP